MVNVHDVLSRVTLGQLEINPKRVMARYLLRANSNSLDRYARISFLEGVAQVPQGAWTKNMRNSMPEVEEKLGVEHVRRFMIHQNSGLVDHMIRQANRYLHADPLYSGEDLVQNAIAGLSNKQGLKKKPLLYSIGSKISLQDFGRGRIRPQVVGRMCAMSIKNMAINLLYKGRAVDMHTEEHHPAGPSNQKNINHIENLPSFTKMNTRSKLSFLIKVLADTHNPLYAKIQSFAHRTLEQRARPQDLAIYLKLLQDIESGTTRTNSDLAKELGQSSAMVTKAKKNIGKVLLDAFQQNPEILKPALKLEDVAQLSTSKYSTNKKFPWIQFPKSSAPS